MAVGVDAGRGRWGGASSSLQRREEISRRLLDMGVGNEGYPRRVDGISHGDR